MDASESPMAEGAEREPVTDRRRTARCGREHLRTRGVLGRESIAQLLSRWGRAGMPRHRLASGAPTTPFTMLNPRPRAAAQTHLRLGTTVQATVRLQPRQGLATLLPSASCRRTPRRGCTCRSGPPGAVHASHPGSCGSRRPCRGAPARRPRSRTGGRARAHPAPRA